MARDNGLNPHPGRIAELGPGDSIGVGLAALLSGADSYTALDVIRHAKAERNLKVLEELVELFAARADIPGDEELPTTRPYLADYRFPADILTPERLARTLAGPRLAGLRTALREPCPPGAPIQYKVPWNRRDVIEPGSLDMIFSQAVLEHVDDLRMTYRTMHAWLAEGGFLSHQIDFRCHQTAKEWNGHWAYSDPVWWAIRGGRPYLINRCSHSVHLRLLAEEGFTVVCDRTFSLPSGLRRDRLAPRFRDMPDEDLSIAGAFIQAIRTD
jgi:hypothetical protein